MDAANHMHDVVALLEEMPAQHCESRQRARGLKAPGLHSETGWKPAHWHASQPESPGYVV